MSLAPATPPGANATRLPTDDELREVAASLSDIVFRRTSAKAAARHLEVVRGAIEVATIDVRVPERPRPGTRPARAGAVDWTVAVTISGGVAQPQTRRDDPHEVLRAAGRALDRSKQAGLNRILVATSEPVPASVGEPRPQGQTWT